MDENINNLEELRIIHEKDLNLIEAIKRRDWDQALHLLEEGADPRWPDESQFNALDYAQMSGNPDFFQQIYSFAKQINVQCLMERLPQLYSTFQTLPDCSLKFTWKVHSWIPFITAFCPSDTWVLWKVGNKFRIDTTLANWADTHWTRGNTSVFFDSECPELLDSFIVIDRVSGERFSVLREVIDNTHLELDCSDILQMDLIKGSIDPESIRITRSRSFFGYEISSQIIDNKWNATSYQLSNAKVSFLHVLSDNYGRDPMPPPLNHHKTYSGTFWCTQDFPIQPSMVIPFFEVMAPFSGYSKNILMLLGMFDCGMPIKGVVNVFPTVKLDFSITDFSVDVESFRDLVNLPPEDSYQTEITPNNQNININ